MLPTTTSLQQTADNSASASNMAAANRAATVWAILLVMVGCGLNNLSLEFIIRSDPSAGNIVTFAQFVCIALEGLYVHLDWSAGGQVRAHRLTGGSSSDKPAATRWLPRLQERVIPLSHYVAMVTIFFTVATLNNAALGYQIALPLHMVFRSGSLIATALIGRLVFKEVYSWSQYLAVLIVSCGIFAATMASAQAQEAPAYAKDPFDLWTWTVGVAMLFVSLVLSSVLGFYQTYAYRTYGGAGKKPYRETQFYSHALALPCFALVWPDIVRHAQLWSSFPATEVLGVGAVPTVWLHLVANVLTQYVCISGVFMLTGTVSPLTTNLVIALRKFGSLVISVYYFGNAFTPTHWAASVAVFVGTFLYSVSQSHAPGGGKKAE